MSPRTDLNFDVEQDVGSHSGNTNAAFQSSSGNRALGLEYNQRDVEDSSTVNGGARTEGMDGWERDRVDGDREGNCSDDEFVSNDEDVGSDEEYHRDGGHVEAGDSEESDNKESDSEGTHRGDIDRGESASEDKDGDASEMSFIERSSAHSADKDSYVQDDSEDSSDAYMREFKATAAFRKRRSATQRFSYTGSVHDGSVQPDRERRRGVHVDRAPASRPEESRFHYPHWVDVGSNHEVEEGRITSRKVSNSSCHYGAC